jgi:hypothetical protein
MIGFEFCIKDKLLTFFCWAYGSKFNVMVRCDEGLGFQLGGMVWEPLGIANFTFSPSPK